MRVPQPEEKGDAKSFFQRTLLPFPSILRGEERRVSESSGGGVGGIAIFLEEQFRTIINARRGHLRGFLPASRMGLLLPVSGEPGPVIGSGREALGGMPLRHYS